jgi:hypothetical protein
VGFSFSGPDSQGDAIQNPARKTRQSTAALAHLVGAQGDAGESNVHVQESSPVPRRSSPRKPPSPSKPNQGFEAEAIPTPFIIQSPAHAERSLPPHSVADSGVFSASNPNSQAEAAEHDQELYQSRASLSFVGRSSGVVGRDSYDPRSSFRTATEDIREPSPASPVSPAPAPAPAPESPDVALTKLTTQEQPVEAMKSPRKTRSPIKKVSETAHEPHPSSSLAERTSLSNNKTSPDPQPETEETIYISPVKATVVALVEKLQSSQFRARVDRKSPEKHIQLEYPALPKSQELVSEATKDDPEGSQSEISKIPSPEAPAIRNNSMTFASLPAREPLTNKKKSLGVKAVRESFLDQLQQSEVSRASWMHKKSNGKSLGGSSKSVVQEPASTLTEEAAIGRKRKSQGGPSPRYRKVSRGQDGPVPVVTETAEAPVNGSDEDSETEARLLSKRSTQQLHDRIQQLKKLNATQSARSLAAPVSQHNSAYPDLSTYDADIDTESAENTTKHFSIGNRLIDGAVKSSSLRMSQASQIDKSVLAPNVTTQTDALRSQNAHRTSSPNTRSQARLRTSIAEAASLNAQSSPKPCLSTSPLKPITQMPIDDEGSHPPVISPKKTPGKDSPLSMVKAHTSSIMKRAMGMLMKSSSTSTSAKAEILNQFQDLPQFEDTVDNSGPGQGSTQSGPPKEKDMYSEINPVPLNDTTEKSEPKRKSGPKFLPTESEPQVRQTRSSRSKAERLSMQAKDAEGTTRGSAPRRTQSARQTRSSSFRNESLSEVVADIPRPKSPVPKKDDRALKQAAAEERLEKILQLEREELNRREAQMLRRQHDEELRQVEKPAIAIPEHDDTLHEHSPEPTRSRMDSAELERPPSRLQQKGMRFQRTDSMRKLRHTKEPVAKPAPVAIMIGTASQREAQDRQKNALASSSSVLISAIKGSLEPTQPSVNPNSVHSQNAVHTPSSATIAKGVGMASGAKRLKSLQSAANRKKKEQEEREKKVAQKKDMDRRRAEIQKKQDEDNKKAQMQRPQKSAAHGSTSHTKSLSRVQPVSNVSY